MLLTSSVTPAQTNNLACLLGSNTLYETGAPLIFTSRLRERLQVSHCAANLFNR